MVFPANDQDAINSTYLADEAETVTQLIARLHQYKAASVAQSAHQLINAIRRHQQPHSLIDSFLYEYQLDSAEGLVLMSIAEALLRIPDVRTQDLLLQDKLSSQLWETSDDSEPSLFVTLSNHALQLAGAIEQHIQQPHKIFQRLISRLGAPLIRQAIKHAMQLLANQFIIAENINQALKKTDPAYCYSFDMLGEAALTQSDAERYFHAYYSAIEQLAKQAKHSDLRLNPGISIKLSALHPRYEPLQHERAVPQLIEKLLPLVQLARATNIMITVDAEESDRLNMSLQIFAALYQHQDFQNWSGLGLAVQAYQKRAIAVIQWLSQQAHIYRKQIPVRLVKGAYWDSEIKQSQERGLSNYPVFTHKSATDISYLACAAELLAHPQAFFAQFATHNAHTVCAIRQLAGSRPFELQRLHGMGDVLYKHLLDTETNPPQCRIYAPVGNYHDLLPYLVRRLLENGANTSFIHQFENARSSIEELIRDPIELYRDQIKNKIALVLPSQLFGKQRLNSSGVNLADPKQLQTIQQQLSQRALQQWNAAPLINGKTVSGASCSCVSPSNTPIVLGEFITADNAAIQAALDAAYIAFPHWRNSTVSRRAKFLHQTADLLEQSRMDLVSLCMREGGRCLTDALNEVREAVDFCRYYAAIALSSLAHPLNLPGPTGESNQLIQYGRGVFVCISPWNFPIAIFVGQIAAALAAGNCIIAKPARQTSLTAMYCFKLFQQAGFPANVIHFLPGEGPAIGKILLSDPRIAGVAFTGSTATARLINQQLAQLPHIVPFIAETGGQNVMIADSSAHTQQLVHDVLTSAFNSAGQRCSALRVLFIQQDCASHMIEQLIEATQQLIVGDPQNYATDVGPVIDAQALERLQAHVSTMKQQGKLLYQLPLPRACEEGFYFPPTLIELNALDELQAETFGPILHIIRFQSTELDEVIDAINHCGYGLTLGIHSRIQQTISRIQSQVNVGNIYVNRNMIGAVVGVQPFGGMGLSGTGPKAGGPHYLQRFTVEQTITVNTTALGGNTQLLSQQLL